jgi:GNAT superfamily N-acetyltransferase
MAVRSPGTNEKHAVIDRAYRAFHMPNFSIRQATEQDVPLVYSFIRQLAEYERLSGAVVMTEATLRESLFGKRPAAEVLLGYADDKPVAFAVFFHNFSTFMGKPGLYLEDLFVIPEMRGNGFGRAILVELARIAVERNCGRFEWSVLDWNEPAIGFYKKLGAVPMDEWTIFRVTGEALERLANTTVKTC